jgi:hypothetical protein
VLLLLAQDERELQVCTQGPGGPAHEVLARIRRCPAARSTSRRHTPTPAQVYEFMIAEQMIDTQLRVYCPYKDCSVLLERPDPELEELDEHGHQAAPYECPGCKRRFCLRCGVAGWHAVRGGGTRGRCHVCCAPGGTSLSVVLPPCVAAATAALRQPSHAHATTHRA